MITLELTKDLDLIKSIITEPKLWELEYGQGADLDQFKVDESFTYLLAKRDDEILGMFQTREVTRVLVDVHIYILPKHWGNSTSKECSEAFLKSVKDYTSYLKVITDVPQSCHHVIKLIKKLGGIQCGYIKDGVIYNNKLQGLILFCYPIMRS